jgi:hypothetical protein
MGGITVFSGPECGSASKRDPTKSEPSYCKYNKSFATRWVPIGADRDPPVDSYFRMMPSGYAMTIATGANYRVRLR